MTIHCTKKSVITGITTTLLLIGLLFIVTGLSANTSSCIRVLWAVLVGVVIAISPKIRAQKFYTYALYGMVLLSVILWGCLCCSENLGYDEAYTIALIDHDIKSLFEITSQDVHTPFYYLVVKAFYHLFGNHIQGAKVCSFIFLLGYELLGLFPIRKEFGTKVSFYFLFFSLTFPCMTVHSTDIRMYTMGLFFVTLTALLAYKLYRNFSVKAWIFFVLSSICTVYVHTYAIISTMIIYFIFFFAIVFHKKFVVCPEDAKETKKGVYFDEKRKQIIFFFLSSVCVILAFLPWLSVLWTQFNTNKESMAEIATADIYTTMDYLVEFYSSTSAPQPLSVLIGFVLTIFLLYFVICKKPTHYKTYICGSLVFLITTVIGAFIATRIFHTYLGRYSYPAFGLLILLLAAGMSQIKDKRVTLIIMLTFLLIGSLHYRDEFKFETDTGIQEFKEFMDENSTPADSIIYSSMHTQMYSIFYPDLNNFIYGYKGPDNPFPNSVAFQDYAQLEDNLGTLWYITFTGDEVLLETNHYTSEEAFHFTNMFYDVTIYRLTPVY